MFMVSNLAALNARIWTDGALNMEHDIKATGYWTEVQWGGKHAWMAVVESETVEPGDSVLMRRRDGVTEVYVVRKVTGRQTGVGTSKCWMCQPGTPPVRRIKVPIASEKR